MVGKMAVNHLFVTTISGSSNKATSSAAAAVWLEPDAVGLFLLVWGICLATPDVNSVSAMSIGLVDTVDTPADLTDPNKSSSSSKGAPVADVDTVPLIFALITVTDIRLISCIKEMLSL